MEALGTAPPRALRRIGEVASITGLTPRAIRYYEQLGMLSPATHEAGTNRRYDDHDVERLQQIKMLRDTIGLSLSEVQTFLGTDDLRRALREEYWHAASAAERLDVIGRADTILRRRVELLAAKVAAVTALLHEEQAGLQRLETLRQEQTALAADSTLTTV